MVDRSVRDEGVEQALNRRPRRFGIEEGVSDIIDHRFVGHLASSKQSLNRFETHRRKIAARDRFHIGTGAFDAEDGDRLASEIFLAGLRGGIAASPKAELRIFSNQAGAVGEKIKLVFTFPRLPVIPAVFHATYLAVIAPVGRAASAYGLLAMTAE
jgi:hypothetical protein